MGNLWDHGSTRFLLSPKKSSLLWLRLRRIVVTTQVQVGKMVTVRVAKRRRSMMVERMEVRKRIWGRREARGVIRGKNLLDFASSLVV